MRTIARRDVGKALQALLGEAEPLESDIGIVDDDGRLLGIVIGVPAYNFLLRKTSEEEDRIDRQTFDAFRASGVAAQ
jgi:hypothetical protein